MSLFKQAKKRGSLSFAIIGVIAITVVVLNLGQICTASIVAKRRLKKTTLSQYERLTRQSSMVYRNLVESYFGYIDLYSKADVVQTGDTQKIVKWMRENTAKRASVFRYMGFADEKGENYTDTGAYGNIADRDYFKAIMSGADRYVDNPSIARTTGITAIHIVVPAIANGKRIGLFYGVVDPAFISDELDEVDMGELGYAIIYAGDGYFIGSSKNDTEVKTEISEIEKNHPESYEFIKSTWNANKIIEGEILSSSGKKQYLISYPIENTQWNFIFVLDEAQMFSAVTLVRTILTGGGILLSILLIGLVGTLIVLSLKPLKIVENTITDIASGEADLTKRINIDVDNEIGRVVDGYNLFAEKLQTIIKTMKDSKNELIEAGNSLSVCTEDTSSAITQIIAAINSMDSNIGNQSDSVAQTAGAVNQIAANIESLNNMIEAQVAAVTQGSAAVEQMINNINSVNSSVQKMDQQFKDLEEKSRNGVQRQADVNARIAEIEEDSQTLQEANIVIEHIASQTNLLAMNAAIEAAHAGESGKGFSVVADEIRKLSEDSTNQSKTIGEHLTRIIRAITDIVSASELASGAFTEVSTGITSTSNLVAEITQAMLEQGEGSKQISLALNAMNDSSNEVRSASVEMAEGNKTILTEIQKLQDSSYVMRNGMNEMNLGAEKINHTGSELSKLSMEIDDSIHLIGNQVDQFTV